MPILDVRLVADALPDDLAARLADRCGAVFNAASGTVWVRLTQLAPHHYAENGVANPAPLPVFVSVLQADTGTEELRAALAADLATAIGDELGLPLERVHLLFEPSAAGRIAFGGQLRRS